jgi:hypothetical protein
MSIVGYDAVEPVLSSRRSRVWYWLGENAE